MIVHKPMQKRCGVGAVMLLCITLHYPTSCLQVCIQLLGRHAASQAPNHMAYIYGWTYVRSAKNSNERSVCSNGGQPYIKHLWLNLCVQVQGHKSSLHMSVCQSACLCGVCVCSGREVSVYACEDTEVVVHCWREEQKTELQIILIIKLAVCKLGLFWDLQAKMLVESSPKVIIGVLLAFQNPAKVQINLLNVYWSFRKHQLDNLKFCWNFRKTSAQQPEVSLKLQENFRLLSWSFLEVSGKLQVAELKFSWNFRQTSTWFLKFSWSFPEVFLKFSWSFPEIFLKFSWSFPEVLLVVVLPAISWYVHKKPSELQENFKETSMKLQGNYKKTSGKLQENFRNHVEVCLKVQENFSSATWSFPEISGKLQVAKLKFAWSFSKTSSC